MTPSDRETLERAMTAISEKAANASRLIDVAMGALPAIQTTRPQCKF